MCISKKIDKKEKNIWTVAVGTTEKNKKFYINFNDKASLLVAGLVKSGKSAFLKYLISQIIKNNKHTEAELILCDSKEMEYNKINKSQHLLFPVISKTEDFDHMLQWLLEEMWRRFELLDEYKHRDIGKFNQNESQKMKRIFLFVDEMSNFVFAKRKSTQESLSSLLAIGRGVGIHLIFATSSVRAHTVPGTTVFMFSNRMSFKLLTKKDSSAIMALHGAEELQGEGEALITTLYEKEYVRKIKTFRLKDPEFNKLFK